MRSDSVQPVSRPLVLRLSSCVTKEEIYVILTEWRLRTYRCLRIFVEIEQTSSLNTGIKHLNYYQVSSQDIIIIISCHLYFQVI